MTTRVEITPVVVDDKPDGWQATINGVTVPLTAFAVEPDDGRMLVSLVVVADTVSIDRSPTAAPAPEPAQKPKRGVWGNPNTPDPRADLPSWEPEGLGAQLAANGEESIRSRMDRLSPNGDNSQQAEVRS